MFQQLSDGNEERAERMAAVCCLMVTAVMGTSVAAAWAKHTFTPWRAVLAAGSTVLVAFEQRCSPGD